MWNLAEHLPSLISPTRSLTHPLSSSSSILPSTVKAASHLQTSPYLIKRAGKLKCMSFRSRQQSRLEILHLISLTSEWRQKLFDSTSAQLHFDTILSYLIMCSVTGITGVTVQIGKRLSYFSNMNNDITVIYNNPQITVYKSDYS